jgi:hypothetical protein
LSLRLAGLDREALAAELFVVQGEGVIDNDGTITLAQRMTPRQLVP